MDKKQVFFKKKKKVKTDITGVFESQLRQR